MHTPTRLQAAGSKILPFLAHGFHAALPFYTRVHKRRHMLSSALVMVVAGCTALWGAGSAPGVPSRQRGTTQRCSGNREHKSLQLVQAVPSTGNGRHTPMVRQLWLYARQHMHACMGTSEARCGNRSSGSACWSGDPDSLTNGTPLPASCTRGSMGPPGLLIASDLAHG